MRTNLSNHLLAPISMPPPRLAIPDTVELSVGRSRPLLAFGLPAEGVGELQLAGEEQGWEESLDYHDNPEGSPHPDEDMKHSFKRRNCGDVERTDQSSANVCGEFDPY